ncbi:MAG: tetratricopeptide repeat protein [Chitinophagales bacterium]|nr:tetratricopeptide repeat protein [Chitinophagales bacterium]
MIRSILPISLIIFLFAAVACNSSSKNEGDGIPKDRGQLASQIKSLEETLLEKINEPTLDTTTANSLIKKSRAFAKQFPQDTLSPEFLFRAADVARGIGQYQTAIEMWHQVETKYESYKKAPEALFLQGFTYDNSMGELENAAKHYQRFLTKHPKHPIASDVQMLLEVAKSGKSPEELIQEFEQKKEN